MRILHVIDSVFKAGGGTSEVVPRLCEALLSHGHEVRLVTSSGGAPSDATIHAQAVGVDVRFCRVYDVPGLSFFRVSSQFRKELEDGVRWANVVHVHGHWQNPGWCAMQLARKYKKPYVIQSHGFLEPERLKISKWKKRLVGALVERPCLNGACAVIATSKSERQGILAFGVKVPVCVVPIGIDMMAFDMARRNDELLKELGVASDRKTLLYLSRVTPIKGLDMLSYAWRDVRRAHADWQLLIVGPDDRGYTIRVKEMFRDLVNDGSVVFSGPVYGERKYELLRSVDAFVLPTRSENWSIAVQEALAAGLPVICTKGAPWQGLEGGDGWGKCGWWVDISKDGIESGIRACLTLGEAERRNMGEEARSFVRLRFSWDIVAERQLSVYMNIHWRAELQRPFLLRML